MENSFHIIAFAGNPHSGKRTLQSKLTGCLPIPWAGFPKTYRYSGRCCLLTDLEIGGYPDANWPDTIVLVCNALCLEQGLHQLKDLLSLDPVREQGIPLVLCINYWDEAEKRGLLIDTELLQDVLQIPVVPCCSCDREQLDDVKAAIHYSLQPAHKNQFYYQCLDFSPGRLTRECIFYTEAACPKAQSLFDRAATCPLTAWILLLGALFSMFRLFF